MSYVHPTTGVIHTGYAIALNGQYITLMTDWYSRGMSYAPCSNQESPHMRYTQEEAEKQAARFNGTVRKVTITLEDE